MITVIEIIIKKWNKRTNLLCLCLYVFVDTCFEGFWSCKSNMDATFSLYLIMMLLYGQFVLVLLCKISILFKTRRLPVFKCLGLFPRSVSLKKKHGWLFWTVLQRQYYIYFYLWRCLMDIISILNIRRLPVFKCQGLFPRSVNLEKPWLSV